MAVSNIYDEKLERVKTLTSAGEAKEALKLCLEAIQIYPHLNKGYFFLSQVKIALADQNKDKQKKLIHLKSALQDTLYYFKLSKNNQ